MPNLTPEKLAEAIRMWDEADVEDRDDMLQDLFEAVYLTQQGQNQ